MTTEICIVEGCTRFRDKKQNRRICQMHRIRYGRHKSYELPTAPLLPNGIVKICKKHGKLTSLGVYKKYKDKPWLDCRICVKEGAKRSRKNIFYQRNYYTIKNKNGNIKIHKDIINKLLEEQNYVCAICKRPESIILSGTHEKPKRLAIDHCHKTKKIRGLLCQKCNTSIGAFNESIEILNSAIEYLKKYQ